MAEELRAQVRKRFRASCAYCGVHEDAVGATLTIDHYRPRAHGGADEEENLVYCCARCNEHKGAYWHEHDPPHVRLLHPGQDDLTRYLHESDDGRIVGLAPEGEFFIQRLRLNRPAGRASLVILETIPALVPRAAVGFAFRGPIYLTADPATFVTWLARRLEALTSFWEQY